MTDQATPTPPTAPEDRRRGCRGRGRGFVFVIALALAAGLTGALVTKAFSDGFGAHTMGWRHGGGFMEGPLDPARIQDRADRMVRHLVVEIDATSEQQEKLRAVMSAAVKDLLPMREKMRDARVRARDLLTQAKVDREAIEKLRTDQIAFADTASKRFTQALADAAEILTAEQRRKISDLVPAGGGHWRGWHRG